MKLILSYLKRHIGIFFVSMTFLTMEAFADLLQPTFMSYIVDEGVANMDEGRILKYGAMMLGIAAIGAFSAVMRNFFASTTSQTIGKELRHDMYVSVQKLSLENIDRLQPASIITRITNDVTQVQEFINGMMRIMVKAPITFIGAILLIILQTPKQAPVIIGIIIVVSFLIFGNLKIGYPKFGKVQKQLDRLNSVTREFLSSVRVVKAFRAEPTESEKFDHASVALADANVSAMRTMAVFSPLINLTVNFGVVLLLWLSRNQDSAQIGHVMASVNYMTQVLFAVGMISNVINTAVRAVASSERIVEVLDEKPAQKLPENPVKADIKGLVEFEKVSFAYAGAGENALKEVSFMAKPGETIGIIGPTGSGKSTLVNLVPRFYDATRGTVKVDGIDVREMDEKTLRTAVAVVPQKAVLFTGTIMDNLRWGMQEASEDELKKATKIACAASFVEKTEKGYESLVGQGGVNLSGGQKQRLALARALVRKPKILILDDCTSALDAETESKVLHALKEQTDSMTVLLISQRISTVMRADHILCIDNGKVQGFGSHRDLMENCAVYQAIYASQIGGQSNG